jgi:hypothetical protein
MRSGSALIVSALVSVAALLAMPSPLSSQKPDPAPIAAAELPEAPTPQLELSAAGPAGLEAQTGQSQSAPQPAPASTPAQSPAAQGTAGQGSSNSQKSSSQPASGQPAAQESQHQKADEQVKQEEHQRVLGIVPNFNLTYLGNDTVSLTAKQKMNLAFHSVIDPVAFIIPFFVTGYHEMLDEDKGFPWGIKGLGERSGAAYLDSFNGNLIGNGILPAILHQDPRYYRMGHGSATRRLFYAAATSFVCKHDNTGKWEPNYSNIGGNIIGGALSNLYYPNSDIGAGLTISNGLIVTAEGAIGSEFDEFWPDVSRKLLHKDPTHGLDAQVRAADEARKKARQSQQ